jgi:predicted ATPase with chaperone activity
LLDRIDLHVAVTPVASVNFRQNRNMTKSEVIRERVIKARDKQAERYKNNPGRYSNDVDEQQNAERDWCDNPGRRQLAESGQRKIKSICKSL